MAKRHTEKNQFSRRNFIKLGGTLVTGNAIHRYTNWAVDKPEETEKYRVMGRTGFKAYTVALGGFFQESAIVRYAYDNGVNYFDTAEGYGNGQSERLIGEAMQFMDRRNIFITTKLWFKMDETEQQILDRFRKCLERMKTDYVDCLYIHAVEKVAKLNHKGFHAAVQELKNEGRLRFAGLSCHGPEEEEHDSMEKILTAAVDDGRFDLMLMSYNFMNKAEAERVIAAAQKRNVGVTAMKITPGVLQIDPVDPKNLTEEYEEWVREMMEEDGMSRGEAIRELQEWEKEERKQSAKIKPFAEKYGITSNEKLREASVQWVLQNPGVHTVCVTMNTFDDIDRFVPLAGSKLNEANANFLEDFKLVYNNRYCRHGCNACVDKCVQKLPVSRIMRYSYYFKMQRREKYAMSQYASMGTKIAACCESCHAPCQGACPYGVNIRENLRVAHSLLTLA